MLSATFRNAFYQRTALQMKKLCYLLTLTLLLTQFDDAWADFMPSGLLPDDSQEYLPSLQRTQREESTLHQCPLFTDLKQQTADFSVVQVCVPCERDPSVPFGLPSLYVFLSLQI